MWPLAVLTGDRINVFFYKDMYGRSPGRKKLAVIYNDCDRVIFIEVAVRRGSTVPNRIKRYWFALIHTTNTVNRRIIERFHSRGQYWNKRKFLHQKRVQFPQGCLGTPTWPPLHCFGTPICRHDVM